MLTLNGMVLFQEYFLGAITNLFAYLLLIFSHSGEEAILGLVLATEVDRCCGINCLKRLKFSNKENILIFCLFAIYIVC